MAVQVVHESTTDETTRKIRLKVENTPILQRTFSPSQRIRVHSVLITVRRTGEWSVWQHYRTRVYGPRVLTNGCEGTELVEEYWRPDEGPEWLRDVVQARLAELNVAVA